MKRITPQRAALFIGVMSVVALIISLPHIGREQKRAQQEVQQQQIVANESASRAAAQAAVQAQQAAAQKAAAEQAAFQAKYLNPGLSRKPGLINVAIAAMLDPGEPNHPVATALADHLRNGRSTLLTSCFSPAFYADGIFASAFDGLFDSIAKLQLTNSLDALLLAREQVEYSTNGADLNNVITARARLEVAFVPVYPIRREQSWTFTASGAGFSQGEARKNADDRLFKQIAGDTNMSLTPLSRDN